MAPRTITQLIASAVLSLFMLAGPSFSNTTLHNDAYRAGLRPSEADLSLDIDEDDPNFLNGFYLPAGTYCVMYTFCETIEKPQIHVIAGRNVPESLQRLVLFHEIGHYHQDRQGRLQQLGFPEKEHEADVFAANMLCHLGYNGPQLTEQALGWLKRHYALEGGPRHGTWYERISNVVHHAQHCKQHQQQPFASNARIGS